MPISSRMVSAVSWMRCDADRRSGSRSADRAARTASTAAAQWRRQCGWGGRGGGSWLGPFPPEAAHECGIAEFAREAMAGKYRIGNMRRVEAIADPRHAPAHRQRRRELVIELIIRESCRSPESAVPRAQALLASRIGAGEPRFIRASRRSAHATGRARHQAPSSRDWMKHCSSVICVQDETTAAGVT